MQTELDQLIAAAFKSGGNVADVNKVYLTLLKTDLIIPAKIHPNPTVHDEPYHPLFSTEGDFIFIAAFDALDKYQHWAKELESQIEFVQVKGRDVIAGIGDNVFLALNPGAEFYKEFSPEEIQRLKTIVHKVNGLTKK